MTALTPPRTQSHHYTQLCNQDTTDPPKQNPYITQKIPSLWGQTQSEVCISSGGDFLSYDTRERKNDGLGE